MTELEYIKVRTSDDKEFTLDFQAFKKSEFISVMFESYSVDDEYEAPVINVSSNILAHIDRFLMHYKGKEVEPLRQPLEHKTLHPDDGIPEWDAEFINSFSDSELYEILNVSNYLGIQSLIMLGCARLALFIKKRTTDKYGKINDEDLKFYMANGMTREEAEQLSIEAKWA